MEKKYFYQVAYKIVEDHEERQQSKDFIDDNLGHARFLAFNYFAEISEAFKVQFLDPRPIIMSFVSISLIQESDDYDFDYGVKIEFRRQDSYILYLYIQKNIEKYKSSFEFESEVFKTITASGKEIQIDKLDSELKENEIIKKIEVEIHKDVSELY